MHVEQANIIGCESQPDLVVLSDAAATPSPIMTLVLFQAGHAAQSIHSRPRQVLHSATMSAWLSSANMEQLVYTTVCVQGWPHLPAHTCSA